MPLDAYLEGHALSYEERVRVMMVVVVVVVVGVAEAVEELHRLELVHRDLKPSSVLVDASQQVRLCDLGRGARRDRDDDALARCEVAAVHVSWRGEAACGRAGAAASGVVRVGWGRYEGGARTSRARVFGTVGVLWRMCCSWWKR